MGILEEIQSNMRLLDTKQDMLMSAIKAIAAGETGDLSFSKGVEGQLTATGDETESEDVAEVGSLPETVKESLGVDSEGQYWDSRIHAKTQKTTAKGVWKLLRGVDKDLVASVKASNALLAESTEDEKPSAPPKPSTGKKPSAPPKPTVGKKAPPAPKKDNNKQKAINEVNRLTEDFSVDYELVLGLLKEMGATNFDDLPAEKYPDAARDFKAWADWLEMCNTEAKRVVDFGGEDGREGLVEIYTGRSIAGIHECKFDDCNALHDALTEYADAWQKYAEEDQ